VGATVAVLGACTFAVAGPASADIGPLPVPITLPSLPVTLPTLPTLPSLPALPISLPGLPRPSSTAAVTSAPAAGPSTVPAGGTEPAPSYAIGDAIAITRSAPGAPEVTVSAPPAVGEPPAVQAPAAHHYAAPITHPADSVPAASSVPTIEARPAAATSNLATAHHTGSSGSLEVAGWAGALGVLVAVGGTMAARRRRDHSDILF
jgi:hypothetical protein